MQSFSKVVGGRPRRAAVATGPADLLRYAGGGRVVAVVVVLSTFKLLLLPSPPKELDLFRNRLAVTIVSVKTLIFLRVRADRPSTAVLYALALSSSVGILL